MTLNQVAASVMCMDDTLDLTWEDGLAHFLLLMDPYRQGSEERHSWSGSWFWKLEDHSVW